MKNRESLASRIIDAQQRAGRCLESQYRHGYGGGQLVVWRIHEPIDSVLDAVKYLRQHNVLYQFVRDGSVHHRG